MKETAGKVFSIAQDHPPVPGCTLSKAVQGGDHSITYFSLAQDTDISAEIYPCHKLILVADGELEVYGFSDAGLTLHAGDGILTPTDVKAGMRTGKGCVYTEIAVRKEDSMNPIIKAGEVFKLADLVPYREGEIANMDVMHSSTMKFALMAFDAGTALPEHAAPGEALIFALDGEGVIRYEGVDHVIHAGENFHFAKGGLHAVKAEKRFKMALLLTLE